MIASTTNPQIKYIRSLLADRRERRRERIFVLEGVRLVADALAHGAVLTLAVYSPDQLDSTPSGRELRVVLEGLPAAVPASEQAVAAAADTVHPQGVVAVARWPEVPAGVPGLLVILDGIQDPGNMGTLLRSAEAVAAASVLCVRGSVDVFSPKVVRAAMGVHFHLAIEQDLTWDAVAGRLTAVEQVFAADAAGTVPYFAVDWRKPSALIVGNEAHGLSAEALALASTLSIPMSGRVESLNAAVAGSVIMFEALRQHTSG